MEQDSDLANDKKEEPKKSPHGETFGCSLAVEEEEERKILNEKLKFYVEHQREFAHRQKSQNNFANNTDDDDVEKLTTDARMEKISSENELLKFRINKLESALTKVKSSAKIYRQDRDRLSKKLRDIRSSKKCCQCYLIDQNSISTDNKHDLTIIENLDDQEEKLATVVRERADDRPKVIGIRNPTIHAAAGAEVFEDKIAEKLTEVPTIASSRSLEIVIKPKLAKNTKLKRTRAEIPVEICGHDSGYATSSAYVTGEELCSIGVNSQVVAEILTERLTSDGDVQEIVIKNSYSQKFNENSVAADVGEFERKLAELQSKIGNLSSENDYLNLTLQHCRSQNENLSSVYGQLESNYTAAQNALISSEKTDSFCEFLLEFVDQKLQQQSEKLATCENCSPDFVAASFAEFLKKNDDSSNSQLPFIENSTTPTTTEDDGFNSGESQGGVAKNPANFAVLFRKFADNLRNLIRRKREIQKTLLDLSTAFGLWSQSSLYSASLVSSSSTTTGCRVGATKNTGQNNGEQIRLENAVLLQELTAIKEQNVELRAEIYLLERDRESYALAIREKLAQLQISRVENETLRQKVPDRCQCQKSMKNPTTTTTTANGNSCKEASAEVKLREQLEDLIEATKECQKMGAIRQIQTENFLADLRYANRALLNAIERQKRKYLERILRLSEQLTAVRSERNSKSAGRRCNCESL